MIHSDQSPKFKIFSIILTFILKIIRISYKWRTNESTNKRELVKVTRTFDLERQKTSKKVAARKKWAKFGLSKTDEAGRFNLNLM